MELTVWRDFYNFWLNVDVPVHWIRFEDMVTNPNWVMTEAMKFLLEVEDLSGTVIEKIIDIVFAGKTPTAYEPRNGKLNQNLENYRPDQLEKYYQ